MGAKDTVELVLPFIKSISNHNYAYLSGTDEVFS